MSEMELSVLHNAPVKRSNRRPGKARRGELFMTVAVGYVRCESDNIECFGTKRGPIYPNAVRRR